MNEKKSKLNKPEDLLSGLPNLGSAAHHDKELIEQAINEVVKVLDPIMNRLGQAISEVQSRLGQLEDLVNGALVDILTERIKCKLTLHSGMKKELPKRAKEEKE